MGFAPKNILSIDIDEDAVVATEMTRRGSQVAVTSSYVAPTLAELKNIFINRTQTTVVSMHSQGLFFKDFPLTQNVIKAKEQSREIVSFLRKQNLPLSLDDCFWHATRKGNYLSLVAARKAQVNDILNQFAEAGFTVGGVSPSSYGLYNLLVHNHQDRGKFFLVYMRAASSDFIIYEDRRLWVYPLPIGRLGYTEGKATTEEFMQELKRVINAHFMQNPAKPGRAGFKIYLGGTVYPERFVLSLQEMFPGSDVVALEPFRKIHAPGQGIPPHAQVMGVGLGVGLAYFGLPGMMSVNLIGRKVKTERLALRINLAEKLGVYAGILILAAMIGINLKLVIDLVKRKVSLEESRRQVTRMLPDIKKLKQEKEELVGADAFLEKRLDHQVFYLNALSAVAAGKSPFIEIREFQIKDTRDALEVFISGTSWDYNEINEFLVKLKKNEGIRRVKIVSSSFPEQDESEVKAIDFKLRFEYTEGSVVK